MNKILLNFKFILKKSTLLTGAIYAIIGFIETFAPLEDIMDTASSILYKIIYSCGILIMVWISTFIGTCFYIALKKQYKLLYVGNGHNVYVEYGDIFNP